MFTTFGLTEFIFYLVKTNAWFQNSCMKQYWIFSVGEWSSEFHFNSTEQEFSAVALWALRVPQSFMVGLPTALYWVFSCILASIRCQCTQPFFPGNNRCFCSVHIDRKWREEDLPWDHCSRVRLPENRSKFRTQVRRINNHPTIPGRRERIRDILIENGFTYMEHLGDFKNLKKK